MDDYLLPVLGTIILLGATYYYFVVMAKPKKLASVPAPMVKKGTAAAAKRKPLKKKVEETFDGPNMTVLYYSQTGTAEDFAQRMANEGKQYGLHTKVVDVEEYDTDNFTGDKHSLVVFCVATYGEGEPPENALQFHEWLMDDSRLDTLMQGSKFSVFGLGDKTYDFFNKMGKVVDAKMEELGSERICERGEGDANGNIEEHFLKWKKQFWTNARQAMGLGEKQAVKVERKCTLKIFEKGDSQLDEHPDLEHIARWQAVPSGTKTPTHFDIRHTYLANILVNRELHSPESDRSCRHIEIELPKSMTYEAGDHLAMFPLNSAATTDALLKVLGADPNLVIALYSNEDPTTPVVGPCTTFAAIQGYYDILAPPRKPMLTMLADYTTNADEKKRLLSLASDDPDQQEEYNKYILHDVRTIAEVLAAFPCTKPPLDHFLELLPRLQPRYYSISSSPHATPNVVHVTAALVEFSTPAQRIHNGVATSWFSSPAQIPASDAKSTGRYPKVPIFIRKSGFHLPKASNTPIIMIGPGTGLAPFRGFLHERLWQKEQQPVEEEAPQTNVLFFGCRRPDQDFIYSDELNKFSETKHAELHVAFSRHTGKKVYVQHLMVEPSTADRIHQLIEEGAYIYVCGDAKNMAKDVNHALRDIVASRRNIPAAEAETFIESLRTKNRYLCDVW